MNWLKEPLVHFVLLASVLFALDYAAREAQKPQILVSQQVTDFLIQQREELELRQLSPDERQSTIDQYIEDEILYSEAYKRGLDKGDSRMRRNLILKMRGLLAGEVAEPTSEQLRQFYLDNPERFTIPEQWSVEQVFFSDPTAAPADILQQLRDGLDPLTVGESRLDLPRNLPGATQSQLVSLFGSDGAISLLAASQGEWIGPIVSSYGLHIVRKTSRRPAYIQPYEQVERYIAGEWIMAQTRARVESEVVSLRNQYDIVIESPASN